MARAPSQVWSAPTPRLWEGPSLPLSSPWGLPSCDPIPPGPAPGSHGLPPVPMRTPSQTRVIGFRPPLNPEDLGILSMIPCDL